MAISDNLRRRQWMVCRRGHAGDLRKVLGGGGSSARLLDGEKGIATGREVWRRRQLWCRGLCCLLLFCCYQRNHCEMVAAMMAARNPKKEPHHERLQYLC